MDPRRKSRWSDYFHRSGAYLVGFFGPVPGAIKNHLNLQELARASITSLCAGGGLYGLLNTLVGSAGSIFPAPGDAALAATILTLILEISRRLDHGTDLEGRTGRSRPLR